MKTKIMLLLMVLLLSMLASNVMGDTRFQNILVPTGSSTISGTMNFSVEVNGTTYQKLSGVPETNITNVSFYITPSGGSEQFVCSNTSNPSNGSYTNWSCDVVSGNFFFDSTTYTVTAKIYNGTGANFTEINSTSVTLVESDNTNPVATITSPTNNGRVAAAFTLTASCNNASSGTLLFGATTYTMTVSGSVGSETCSYTFSSGQPADKIYGDVAVTSTDENSDSTTGGTITVDVQTRSGRSISGGGGIPLSLIDQPATASATTILGIEGTDSGGALSLDAFNIILLIAAAGFLVLPQLAAFRVPGLAVVFIVWVLRLIM